jgi:hypothetical protein
MEQRILQHAAVTVPMRTEKYWSPQIFNGRYSPTLREHNDGTKEIHVVQRLYQEILWSMPDIRRNFNGRSCPGNSGTQRWQIGPQKRKKIGKE